MSQVFLDGRIILHSGDCLAVLDTLPANSVDAVITDPPYHYETIVKRFGKTGSAEAQFGSDGAFKRAAAGFMGKQWDGGDVAFDPNTWAKVLRVLKPGGTIAAFSAPKCYHKMVFAIELAGFEMRDRVVHLYDLTVRERAFLESLSMVQQDALIRIWEAGDPLGDLFWTFGSGFPKSHDVSKAIDKRKNWSALPKLQEAIRIARKALGISQSEAARRMGLIKAGEALGGGGFMWFETGMRAPTREQWPQLKAALSLGDAFDPCFEEAEREITGTVEEWSDRSNYALTSKDGFRRDKPASEAAVQWQGWGTALKPAYEPIALARKPLAEGSVAAQVLKTGTGALNIDGCRVDTDEIAVQGRWPANIVHDGSDAVVEAFPDAPGQQRSTGPDFERHSEVYGKFAGVTDSEPRDSGGTAARFFYTAKADGDDRLGSGHPTVKPINLMRWLCRLLTSPRGVILDPFSGTGTTGEAAFLEGFSAVLIEREEEYRNDIARRMDLVLAGPDARKRESGKAKAERRGEALEPLALFEAMGIGSAAIPESVRDADARQNMAPNAPLHGDGTVDSLEAAS